MRTKDALTIVALALLTLHTTARAETIDECQELAKQNYPLIKRYDLISQTARYTESVIKKEWLPQIEFYAQATWQNRVPELPDILTSILKQQGSEPDGAKKTQYQVGLELRQWLYDGGNRRTAQNTATAQRSVDEARNDVDMYAVRQRVSDVYFGWLLIEANR